MTLLIRLYVVLNASKVLHVSEDFSSARESKQLTKFKMICTCFAVAVQALLLWVPKKKPDAECQWHFLICMATSKNM